MLPRGPKWDCEEFIITGDERNEKGRLKMETIQLWKWDPVECVKELIGNPAFWEKLRYSPQRAYEDKEGKSHIFDEMWTGDWWWNLQVSTLSHIFDIYLPSSRIGFGKQGTMGQLYHQWLSHLIKPSYPTLVVISQPGLFIWPLGILRRLCVTHLQVEQLCSLGISPLPNWNASQSQSGRPKANRFSMTVWRHFWSLWLMREGMGCIWHVQMALCAGCFPSWLHTLPIIPSSVLLHAAKRIDAPVVKWQRMCWGLQSSPENETLLVRWMR